MKLHFIGAAHEVTGSLHYLEACGLNIVVDCGMEQGRNPYENAELPIKYSDIDFIFITHAHIDHTGMIPYAYKMGFRGSIYCTTATYDLAEIMLRDSAHIQMSEVQWKNRKRVRQGLPALEALYDLNDANNVLEHFIPVDYGKTLKINDNLSIRFTDAGHLLGSASIEVFLDEDGEKRKLVFSGDIGNSNKPIIRDPRYIEDADYILMESTYGGRYHDYSIDHIGDLVKITQRTLDRGGNVVIPAFAVGRTQELLYLYRRIKHEGLIKGHDGFPVYVDSPLAVEATHVFKNNLTDCYDDETKEIVMKGINPISFRGLELTITSDESKLINADDVPKVIISAAGMCNAGRIRHHLKHNLWRKESTIVFAGYQAEGTLGRTLLNGTESVKLFGEEVRVRAEIAVMPAMSSHADQDGLMEWIKAYKKEPNRVFLVHGDDECMEYLKNSIIDETGYSVDCPYSGSIFDLIKGEWEYIAEPVPTKAHEDVDEIYKSSNQAFSRLMASYNNLILAVKSNHGGANKDLDKFTEDIRALHEKWLR